MFFELITFAYGLHWILFSVILCLFLYCFVFKYWNYFHKQNIKVVRGLPLLGVYYKMFFGQKSQFESVVDLYKQYPNERFLGIFDLGGSPSYFIRDPELIKQITIKDFDHFVNHTITVHDENDPLLARTLFNMTDQRWKDMRSTLSPAFTGTRMRLMFGLVADVLDHFCAHLNKMVANGNDKMEMKNLFTGLTSDAIASCAFGVESNSVEDRNTVFYQCGQRITNVGLKFLGYVTIPAVMNFFKIRIFPKVDTEFFRHLVKENIEFRKQNNVRRNDMIDLLIDAQKGTLKQTPSSDKHDDMGLATVADTNWENSEWKKWSDDDLAAQCMLFFLAGFNGIAMFLSMASYQLAINPDTQQKLHDEIKEVREQLNGNRIDYDRIQKMKYLDMVASETLRMYPLSAAGDRKVTKDYTIEGYNGNKVELKAGSNIWLATAGIHMDAQYFTDPERFWPERFSDENRPANLSTIYIPFGAGPRNCIGNRFALMECKASLYYLINEFKLEPYEQTDIPFKMKPATTNIEAENGIWLKVSRRN